MIRERISLLLASHFTSHSGSPADRSLLTSSCRIHVQRPSLVSSLHHTISARRSKLIFKDTSTPQERREERRPASCDASVSFNAAPSCWVILPSGHSDTRTHWHSLRLALRSQSSLRPPFHPTVSIYTPPLSPPSLVFLRPSSVHASFQCGRLVPQYTSVASIAIHNGHDIR